MVIGEDNLTAAFSNLSDFTILYNVSTLVGIPASRQRFHFLVGLFGLRGIFREPILGSGPKLSSGCAKTRN